MRRFKPYIKKLLSPIRRTSEARIPMGEEVWSIGIYIGESPLNLYAPKNINNPVLTREDVSDIAAAFVADPFMLKANHTWYMFFEVKNRRSGKGEIGLAESADKVKWAYQRIVLAEPFHLSYPYVFEWGSNYYMIPESHKAKSVRLYRALEFPTQWSFVKTLISGDRFLDPSIFHYNDKWWLFTGTSGQIKYDTLRLYYSHNLIGPWLEHPKSPIIEGNAHIARPAGRALVVDNKIVRYAQDCYPVYGTQVQAFEVSELTSTSYQERKVSEESVLKASGSGWNSKGMHHVDSHFLDDGQWIACVDGWFSTEFGKF
jgi:hypothetical protein